MNAENDPLMQACGWLRSQQNQMVEQLIAWSQIGSGSRDLPGLETMSAALCRDWAAQAIPLQRCKLLPISEVNSRGDVVQWNTVDALIARQRPQASRRVLLAIHFDTVYEHDNPFKQCQWIDHNRLRGPGVIDAKGGLLVMMWALAAIEKFNLAPEIGWTAILNPDEEIGSPASAALFQQEAGGHRFGLLFEPCFPDGAMVSQRKGSGNFTIVVRGRAAHAGRHPELGRNAIVMLSKIVAQLDLLNDLPGGLIVNVGRVEGGGPLNRVPDLAIGRLNVRAADAEVQAKFEANLQRIIAGADQNEGFDVVLHGGFHAPPKVVDDRMRWVQRAVEASTDPAEPDVVWQPTGGACDGNKLAYFGLPNVDTLGPRGGDLHSPNEWIDTSTLIPKAERIVRLLSAYSGDRLAGTDDSLPV